MERNIRKIITDHGLTGGDMSNTKILYMVEYCDSPWGIGVDRDVYDTRHEAEEKCRDVVNGKVYEITVNYKDE